MIATSFFSAIPDKGILHVLRVLFGHLLCRHRVQKRHVTAGVPKGYASLSLTQARTHVAVVRTRTWSEHIPYCRLAKGTIVTSIFCKSPCPSQRPDAASPALTVCPLVMEVPTRNPENRELTTARISSLHLYLYLNFRGAFSIMFDKMPSFGNDSRT